MKRACYFFTIIMASVSALFAQSIGIGTDTPNAQAIVDIESNNKGFLMPRYGSSSTDRSHSVAAEDGMLFYDVTSNNVMLYNNTGWISLGFLPVGAIAMWDGPDYPPGWVLCDGTNGTPDLRNKFVVGYDPADPDYNYIGKPGGTNHVALNATSYLPEHSHSVNDPGHSHSASATHAHRLGLSESSSTNSGSLNQNGGGSPNYIQTITTPTTTIGGTIGIGVTSIGITEVGYIGNGEPHENRPPYYVLAYIMKKY